MKKLLFLMILTIGLCTSCKKEEVALPMLLPTDVISLEEAQKLIGESYTLTMKDNAVKQEENLLSVKYLSEPLGSGDSISIELTTPDKTHDEESVKAEFSASQKVRSDCILVKGLGDDAYITYPSLHLYTDSVYVKITAGSKASEAQAELLVELGKIAEKNIAAYFGASHSLHK